MLPFLVQKLTKPVIGKIVSDIKGNLIIDDQELGEILNVHSKYW